jgi:predicted RNase H-like nuclease
MLVAGVDGCRTGWVVAIGAATGGGPVDVRVVPAFAEVLALDLAAVGVDIPIGLPPAGVRACDVETRGLLGPRRSSVFPAPPRAVVGASTWEEANARSRAVDGRGLPRQTFGLLTKITEVDRLITPADQERVVEVHPELAFAGMAGAPMAFPKRSPEGRAARAALVSERFGPVPRRLPGAAPDDILDACAVLWVTGRFHRGEHQVVGDGARDERGLRMEIVS